MGGHARAAVGLYFGAYEWARGMMSASGDCKDLSHLQTMAAGGVGGIACVPAGGFAFAQLPTVFAIVFANVGRRYWTCTYPVDIVKSYMQTDAVDPRFRKYRSSLHCAREMCADGRDLHSRLVGRVRNCIHNYIHEWCARRYADGGLRAFGKGFLPCIIRAFPANAVGFAVFEAVAGFLRARRDA